MHLKISPRLIAAFATGTLLGVVGTVAAATVLGSAVFPDVPEGAYFDSAVGEMYDIGVIKGNPDGTFKPGDFVSRADIAVMLQRLRNELTGNVEQQASSRRSTASVASNATSSAASSVVANNPKGTLRFTTSEFRVPENVATKRITIAVVRTGGNEGSATVDYAVTANTASADTDFTKVSGTLTFANQETSKTFDIQITDDGTGEGNETATMTLSNPTNGISLGSPSTATLVITDNESSSGSSGASSAAASTSSAGPSVGFSAAQYSVNESAGSLTVTVVRSGSTSGNATVNYTTGNGSGTSGSDYTATSGTLSFGGGESSKTFTVAVSNDSSADGSKTFNLSLTNPSGVQLTANLGTASVTINDDESVDFGTGSFKFSKATYAVTENSGQAVLTVQRTGGSVGTASVAYATTSGSANGGTDFTHTSGTLTFAAGEAAKIITIPITKDTIADTGETFNVDLTSPTNGTTLISPYNTTVSIE